MTDQSIADAAQCLNVELIGGLGRDEIHDRALDSFGDWLSVSWIEKHPINSSRADLADPSEFMTVRRFGCERVSTRRNSPGYRLSASDQPVVRKLLRRDVCRF